MFALLYTLATAAVWLVSLPLLPLFLLKAKYRHSLPARWLLWRNPPLPAGRLWFHACSLGETRALKPLLEAFEKEAVLSVITQTGYEAGRGLCREVRYLPFEPLLWLWERPQKALVVMEAELWFLLFYLAKARGAKTFLINARISERSFPRYLRFRWLYRRIFAQVDTVFAQSEADKARLEALGARRVEVTGNIKLAQKPEVSRRYQKPPSLVVTAASTHEGEEPGILEAFALFGKRHEGAKLLLV
ncbi:glycosyltransferase N-terminal domain-containing protein, partial [Hydrogenimonas sp.]